MIKLRETVKRLSFLPSVCWRLRSGCAADRSRSKIIERIFADIFESNSWGGKESVSGPGSDIQQTEILIEQLPILFREYEISAVLDIPCGDFHWMKTVDLSGVKYRGADIVKDIVRSNKKRFGRNGVRFKKLDLINDRLPKADLILCRDGLVHFSFDDIFRALENICRSRSRYLLTTTFPARPHNEDIETGWWRVLNLEAAPFMLPRPLMLINEGCSENDGIYNDKSLGLWNVADLRKVLSLGEVKLSDAP